MHIVLQFVGALGILVPFALFQVGRISQHHPAYLGMNLFGSTLLAVVAWLDAQWGFVILQGVWALAAALGLGRRARRPSPASG